MMNKNQSSYGAMGERYAIYFQIITKEHVDVWIELRLNKHFLILEFCNFGALNLAPLIFFHSDHLCGVCLHAYVRLPPGSWRCEAPCLSCLEDFKLQVQIYVAQIQPLRAHDTESTTHAELNCMMAAASWETLRPRCSDTTLHVNQFTMLHGHCVRILCVHLWIYLTSKKSCGDVVKLTASNWLLIPLFPQGNK